MPSLGAPPRWVIQRGCWGEAWVFWRDGGAIAGERDEGEGEWDPDCSWEHTRVLCSATFKVAMGFPTFPPGFGTKIRGESPSSVCFV